MVCHFASCFSVKLFGGLEMRAKGIYLSVETLHKNKVLVIPDILFNTPRTASKPALASAVSNQLPNICFLSHRSVVAHICFFPCSMKQGQIDSLLRVLSTHCGENLVLCFRGMC